MECGPHPGLVCGYVHKFKKWKKKLNRSAHATEKGWANAKFSVDTVSVSKMVGTGLAQDGGACGLTYGFTSEDLHSPNGIREHLCLHFFWCGGVSMVPLLLTQCTFALWLLRKASCSCADLNSLMLLVELWLHPLHPRRPALSPKKHWLGSWPHGFLGLHVSPLGCMLMTLNSLGSVHAPSCAYMCVFTLFEKVFACEPMPLNMHVFGLLWSPFLGLQKTSNEERSRHHQQPPWTLTSYLKTHSHSSLQVLGSLFLDLSPCLTQTSPCCAHLGPNGSS